MRTRKRLVAVAIAASLSGASTAACSPQQQRDFQNVNWGALITVAILNAIGYPCCGDPAPSPVPTSAPVPAP